MVTISQTQLDQVEYLIGRSLNGFHVLFNTEQIKNAFRSPPPPKPLKGPKPEELIEQLIARPSMEAKREFLRNLDPIEFDNVVRMYFNIIENNIYQQSTYLQ